MLITLENPDDLAKELYDSFSFEINEGLTVLTGPNGSGKTTLLNLLQDFASQNRIQYYCHNADTVMGMFTAEFSRETRKKSSVELVSQYLAKDEESEGENIVSNFAFCLSGIGETVSRLRSGDSLMLLIDSIDSGVSIDRVREIKRLFLDTMLSEENIPSGARVYIIVSANTFELARDCDCLDVSTGKHLRFEDYESYASYIVNQSERQRKRN